MKIYDFIKDSRFFLVLSSFFILISIVSLVYKGFNWGVNFTNGVLIKTEEPINKTIIDKFYKNTIIQNYDNGIIIEGNEQSIADILEDIETVEVNSISPQLDSIKNWIYTVLISIAAISFYLIVRFKFYFKIILYLFCNTIIVLGFISLFGLSFDLITMLAVLIVITCFAINLIILFEDVAKNGNLVKDFNIKYVFRKIININILVVLSVLPLLFTKFNSLRNFAIVMFIGVITALISPIIMFKKTK